ncbi:MAG: hypothetical protein FJZ01_19985 [Candidatus Sericytochromatia bacterium]|nr:hypothetical protein [Candidatus Tanganyikabacteria bacterium]
MFACHACRHPLSLASKFCPHCGAPIRGTSLLTKSTPDLRSSTRELVGMLSPMQVVTLVLGDVAAFVEAYAAADTAPETRKTFEALLAEPITRRGGVAKSHEGFTLGLFGVPVGHDDDALRAIEAATEMREVARALAAEAVDRLQFEPKLTISVNTGIVSASVGGDQGIMSVLGEALEEAGRVQGLARKGSIAVCEKIRTQAGSAHDFAELAPVLGEPRASLRVFELVE